MSIGQKLYGYECNSCGFEKEYKNLLLKNLDKI